MTIPPKTPEGVLREALERIATHVEWPAQMAREALREADALIAATPACTTCGKFSNPNCSNGFHATPPSGSGEPMDEVEQLKQIGDYLRDANRTVNKLRDARRVTRSMLDTPMDDGVTPGRPSATPAAEPQPCGRPYGDDANGYYPAGNCGRERGHTVKWGCGPRWKDLIPDEFIPLNAAEMAEANRRADELFGPAAEPQGGAACIACSGPGTLARETIDGKCWCCGSPAPDPKPTAAQCSRGGDHCKHFTNKESCDCCFCDFEDPNV